MGIERERGSDGEKKDEIRERDCKTFTFVTFIRYNFFTNFWCVLDKVFMVQKWKRLHTDLVQLSCSLVRLKLVQ